MFKLLILVSSIYCANAFVSSLGKCPDVKLMQDFQPIKYAGKWYENKKYPIIWEVLGKCITAEYSIRADGKLKVVNTEVNVITGFTKTIEGVARNVSATEGKYLVNFPIIPVKLEAPYWVLHTDYDNFSVVWSCAQIFIHHFEFVWILTREAIPSQQVLNAANKVLDEAGISQDHFIVTDQINCRR